MENGYKMDIKSLPFVLGFNMYILFNDIFKDTEN